MSDTVKAKVLDIDAVPVPKAPTMWAVRWYQTDVEAFNNQIVGPEAEAVELYPAGSRLVDPSNFFYLWAIPEKFPFGLSGPRLILDAHEAIAPQRLLAASALARAGEDGGKPA